MSEYDPSYFNPDYIVNGKLLNISNFVADVKKACQQYLQHASHHGNLNPTVAINLTDEQSGAATGCRNWTSTYDNLIDYIDVLITDFVNKYVNKCPSATAVWNLLVTCFHSINRIAVQQYSYYNSINDESTTTWSGAGILELYQSLNDYTQHVNNIRITYQLDRSFEINSDNITAALRALMLYNASCELLYNYGTRNKKKCTEAQHIWYSTGGGPESNDRMWELQESFINKGLKRVWVQNSANIPYEHRSVSYFGKYCQKWDRSQPYNVAVFAILQQGEEDGNGNIYILSKKAADAGYVLIPNKNPSTSITKVHDQNN